MKIKRLISFLLLFALFSGTLSSCRYLSVDYYKKEERAKVNKYSITVSDFSGNSYILEKAPAGIYVSSPSAAEIIVELGAGRLIKSCSAECKELSGMPSSARVSSSGFITPDALKSLGIDTVIFSSEDSGTDAEALKNEGFNVFVFSDKGGVATAEANIRLAGAVTFKSDLAETIIKDIRDDISVVKALAAKAKIKRKVYAEGGTPDKYFAYSAGSMIGELITLAGGENVFTNESEETVNVDASTMLQTNPEIIISFVDAEKFSANDIRKRKGFENISACKNGQVFLYDSTMPAVRPAPSLTDALYQIAKFIGTAE